MTTQDYYVYDRLSEEQTDQFLEAFATFLECFGLQTSLEFNQDHFVVVAENSDAQVLFRSTDLFFCIRAVSKSLVGCIWVISEFHGHMQDMVSKIPPSVLRLN
jgi:hypothetical protein